MIDINEEYPPWWVADPGQEPVGAMLLLKCPYLQHERFSFGFFQDAFEFALETTYAQPSDITGVLVDGSEVWLTGAKNPEDLMSLYWRHS